MSIKINFDASHNPEQPTLVLATRNGTKLGGINARNIVLKESSTSEISFVVNKYVDGVEDELWEKIKNFKLVWCKEWDTWFEIYVEIDETDNTQKIVSGVNLGVAELSQAVLYGMQVNTEEDIAREDYSPTVLWDAFNTGGSLLHRILLEKAQHYSVIHVDDTIAKIQRTFTFDGVSIYDAFQQISEEIGCIFVLNSDSDEDGNIQRTISVFDTHSICNDCHYRGDFIDVCPECSSTNVTNTYGEDTTIFITSDDLTDDIQFTSDTDSIKNCFKLVAGDDLMTATVMNCNPNGSDYIWRFSEETREDMNPELVEKIDEYDDTYEYYQKEYAIPLSDDLINSYNALVDKYKVWNADLKKIEPPVKGYPALMDVYYDVIDFAGYLRTSLMPNVEMDDTSAEAQAALLTETNMNPIAVTDLTIISSITAENAVLNMARCIVDQRYQVKIGESAFTSNQWSGTIVVVNYSDKEDTATSKKLYIEINDDFKTYIEQKIYKALAKTNGENMGIVGLFERDLEAFKKELKEYSLDSLKIFLNCCQGCLDVMVEAGVADESAWLLGQDNLYAELYTPYYQKYVAIEEEMAVRQSELDVLEGVLDINGGVVKDGLQTQLEEFKQEIQSKLNFQTFLGDKLWLEFCAYRRDDEYSNQNFVSDGLTNAELFSRALEFLKLANEELYRSSELQHSVTVSSLKNFLLIDRFKGFADHFEIGNWMRVRIDDKVYKLRLLEYEIDYDSIENISVTFSDVIKVTGGLSSVQTALQQVQSMASSYDSVQRQAVDGAQGSKYIKTWFEDGLDVTNTYIANNSNGQVQTWDEHGMLFRAYDPISEMYDEIQMKIINSTLVVTDDNWEHVKTAIGMFYYVDPVESKVKVAYGINAEMVIGKMILGQNLGLYNDENSLTFNKDGLTITNGTNTFVVNPNDPQLLKISNDGEDVLWVDDTGKLHIRGDGAGLDIESNDFVKNMDTRITQNASDILLEAKRANDAEGELRSSIQLNADGIRLESERAQGKENELKSYIDINSAAIHFVVQGDGQETSYTITDGAMQFIAENIKITGRVTIDWFESDTKDTFNKSLKDTVTLYAINNSSTVPPSQDNLELWSETVDWTKVQNSENHFVWQIVVTTNNNGDKIASEPVCISEGKEIKKIETQYREHTSAADPPVGETGWSTSFPNYNVGKFIWSRQLVTYTDNTTKAFDLKFESGLTQAFQRSDNVADVVSSMHYVYYQPEAPVGNHVVGDVWYQTKPDTGDYGEVISIFLWVEEDGVGKWEEQKNGGTTILNGTITTDLIAANAITSNQIAAHAITGDMVDTGKLQVTKEDGTVLFLADMDNGVVKIVADEFSLSNGDTIYSVTESAKQDAEDYADEAASSAASGAISGLTQRDIFNKLTNNGAVSGIFLNDYGLYINADFMSIDELSAISADLGSITAGSLKNSSYGWNGGNFASNGMLIDLDSSTIRGTHFAMDSSGAYFSGDVLADSFSLGGATLSIESKSIQYKDFRNENGSGVFSQLKYFADQDMFVIDTNYGLYVPKLAYFGYSIRVQNDIHSDTVSTDTLMCLNVHANSIAEGGQALSSKYAAYYHSHDNYLTASSDTIDYLQQNVVDLLTDMIELQNTVSNLESSSGGGLSADDISSLYFGSLEVERTAKTDKGAKYGICPPEYTSTTYYVGIQNLPWAAVYAQTGTIQSSDRRLKKSIEAFTPTHEAIYMELKPVSYKFKNLDGESGHDRTHYGFIAQDVEETLTKYGLTAMDCAAVCKDEVGEDDYYRKYGIDDWIYSFRYDEIVSLNTHMTQKALRHQQEQDELISKQEQIVVELLSRLSNLEQQVASSN